MHGGKIDGSMNVLSTAIRNGRATSRPRPDTCMHNLTQGHLRASKADGCEQFVIGAAWGTYAKWHLQAPMPFQGLISLGIGIVYIYIYIYHMCIHVNTHIYM